MTMLDPFGKGGILAEWLLLDEDYAEESPSL